MVIKQLSVFIENRAGRLEQVTETLKEHGINITSLSLADTMEYGMLHELLKTLTMVNIEYMYALATNENAAMILKISNIEAAQEALLENGFELLNEELAYTING